MEEHFSFPGAYKFEWPKVKEHPRLFRGASRTEIFQVAGALQLKAKTTGELIVFHRLAALGRSLAEHETGFLSSGRLRAILGIGEISGKFIQLQADPPEGPLTVEVPSQMGPTTVFQGLNSFSGTETMALLTAVRASSSQLSTELRKSITVLSDFVLSVSRKLAARADIKPNSFLSGNEYTTPQYSKRNLDELRQLVTFGASEVYRGFSQEDIMLLKRLLFLDREIGTTYSEDSVFDKTTFLSPFYEWNELVIVHSPMDLLPALQHSAVQIARELNETTELYNALTKTNRNFLKGILERFGHIDLKDLSDVGENLLIHDSKSKVGATNFRFESPTETRLARLSDSKFASMRTIFGDSSSNENVTVMVISNFDMEDEARFYGFESDERTIVVHLDELEVILYFLDFDLTRLKYFICAVQELDRDTPVFSILDQFAVYRESQFSFYLSDGERPTSTFFVPNTASELWQQYYDEIHPRWFGIPRTSQCVKAMKADIHRANWYVALLAGNQIYFAESRDTIIAVIHDASTNETLANLKKSKSNFARTIFESFAFWLSEFLDWLPKSELQFCSNKIAIFVTVNETQSVEISCDILNGENSDFWLKIGIPEITDIEKVDTLAFDASIIEIVFQVIQALADCSPAQLEGSHRDFLSNGLFKRMRKFTSESPEFPLNWGAPAARLLSEEQVSRELDALGEYLRGAGGLRTGAIATDDRISTINRWVVPYFGDTLTSKIDEYSRRDLLHKLLLRHESLLQFSTKVRKDFDARTKDPKIAQRFIDREVEKLSRISTTLLSSRFLIEYSSFVGDNKGRREIRDEEYDHMLALSSEVINRGILSDSLANELADVSLSILPSGRFGVSRDDEYTEAVETFISSKLQQGFTEMPSFDWFLDDTALIDNARKAFNAENGITIDALSNVIHGLIDRLNEKSLDVDMASREEITQYLADFREVPPKMSNEVLNLLTLSTGYGKKEEFWLFGKEVQPWKFNRKHSILNQSIILIEENNSTKFLHGKRTLQQSFQYKLQGFVESRGQGISREARSYSSRLNDKRGKAFEKQAIGEINSMLRGKAQSRVTKFGSIDLENYKGKNLGDIDLIYFDEVSHTMWIAELKALLGGRLPHEYISERDKLFGRDSSAETRLKNRVEVVNRHLDLVLTEFGIDGKIEEWNVSGVIIVESEILSALLNRGEFPILKLEQFIDTVKAHETSLPG